MTISSVAALADGEPAGDAPARAAQIVGRFVDQLVELEHEITKLQARKSWLVDQARQWSDMAVDAVVSESFSASFSATFSAAKREELSRRSLTSEIACALRLPDITAGRLLDESESLVHELPETRAALSSGALSYRHAQVVIDQARSLPPAARGAFESAVLPGALTTTASQFARKARAEREKLHPESMVTRALKAAEDRHVSFEPDRDGMAWLHHYLPAVDAVRIDDTLDQLARGLRHGATANSGSSPSSSSSSAGSPSDEQPETRTLTQLKSDVLRDLILSDPATGEPLPLRPTVIVTVPVMTLLGHSETPASLDGYGPIDPVTARELCRHAPSFMRILTHPETGATLSVGRDQYRPPADLKLALHVADQTCRFPGCSRRAARCDIDHTLDWQHGGATDFTNLAHLCPKHHHLKHETAWSVSIDRYRTLSWKSPAGKAYATLAVSLTPQSPKPQSPKSKSPSSQSPNSPECANSTAGASSASDANSPSGASSRSGANSPAGANSPPGPGPEIPTTTAESSRPNDDLAPF
ncbi:HNH endonuclease signature motif containing protein [Subtercola endophyticus]|uniref:HNH endonuclease signature motif containing protein n=1 Tax=Subtercola endophyticus TaxID=2895559 RepID=UPI001E618656|nr:HNH endonuclease signature motif containing protein [Subtercola endophyticus]UFS60079.1 HNH endonuclease [Subtercola endophyticus]